MSGGEEEWAECLSDVCVAERKVTYSQEMKCHFLNIALLVPRRELLTEMKTRRGRDGNAASHFVGGITDGKIKIKTFIFNKRLKQDGKHYSYFFAPAEQTEIFACLISTKGCIVALSVN